MGAKKTSPSTGGDLTPTVASESRFGTASISLLTVMTVLRDMSVSLASSGVFRRVLSVGVLNTLETRWTAAPAAREVRILYSPPDRPTRLPKRLLTRRGSRSSLKVRLKRVRFLQRPRVAGPFALSATVRRRTL